MTPARAVIIEDSVPLGTSYSQMLQKLGFEVDWFELGEPGLLSLQIDPPDVLLLDLELPDIHGLEILAKLQKSAVDYPRIVITGHGSVDAAVAAIDHGACDFIEKPFTAERLGTTIDTHLEKARLQQEVRHIREAIVRDGYAGFIGSSLPMQVVYRIIDSAAASRASVFITGESGTGKELCAQAIHERSDRSDGPFVALNCGAIPRELFESEIFGHTKGAFSGATTDRAGAAERADGGTLFLDEIGEMDMDLQVKLLRFIQTGMVTRVGGSTSKAVNVRFVCATNRDPEASVAEGLLREDLYYRLNVIPIVMPALRDRDDDILKIAESFLEDLAAQEGRPFEGFGSSASEALLSYEWPGNVRQLHNVVHNAVLLNTGEWIEREMLPPPLGNAGSSPLGLSKPQPANAATPTPSAVVEPLWQVEKRAIEHAIQYYGDNIPVAAAHLGVSASTIYRKIKTWQSQSL